MFAGGPRRSIKLNKGLASELDDILAGESEDNSNLKDKTVDEILTSTVRMASTEELESLVADRPELADEDTVRGLLAQVSAGAATVDSVTALLAARHAARKARNWGLADSIRDELGAAGVVVQDDKGRVKFKL